MIGNPEGFIFQEHRTVVIIFVNQKRLKYERLRHDRCPQTIYTGSEYSISGKYRSLCGRGNPRML